MTIESLLENMTPQEKDDLLKSMIAQALETDGEIPNDVDSFNDPLRNWIHDRVLTASYQAERAQSAVVRSMISGPCQEKVSRLVADTLEIKKSRVNEWLIADQLRFLILEGGIRRNELRQKTRLTIEL